MQEIDLEENGNFNCPICGTTIFDYEIGEMLVPCSHILLIASSALSNEFAYYQESMKLVADDMIDKEIEFYENDEEISLFDIMEDYAKKSDGKIEVYVINSQGVSCGPCGQSDYVMVQK